MAQESYIVVPQKDEHEVYLHQIGKKDYEERAVKKEGTQFIFQVPEKQGNVMIGIMGTPHRPPCDRNNCWDDLELWAWILFLLLLFATGVIFLWRIAKGKMKLDNLLCESDGKASLSRFQAFIFTFVFVIGVMLILVRTGEFPTDIPLSVLSILGGSLATYLISKGIGQTKGDMAPSVATTSSRGPLLRCKPLANPFTVQDNALIRLSNGSAFFTLPTVTGEPQQYTVIAVGVGDNSLVLRPRVTDGTSITGKVQFVDANGAIQTAVFIGEYTVKTPTNKVTEVGVAFTSETAGILVNLEVVPS